MHPMHIQSKITQITQIMILVYSLCVFLRNLWIIEFMYLPKSRDLPGFYDNDTSAIVDAV